MNNVIAHVKYYNLPFTGEIESYYNSDGNWIGGSHICCGEWITYDGSEHEEFMDLLRHYGIKESED